MSITAPSGTICPSALRVLSCAMSAALGAERRIRLRHHAVRAAEVVEVVDVEAAEVNLQRVEDVGDRDVLLLGLHAIDVGVELRDVGAEAGETAGCSFGMLLRRASIRSAR